MARRLALLALGLVAVFFMFQGAGGSTAEAVNPCPTSPIDPKAPCYVVNATTDLPDRDGVDRKCEAAPAGSNKCTLRAAIEQANFEGKPRCSPCTILFDPAVFPKGPPGGPQTIVIDSSGESLLPPIEVPLTIDATGAGVILEPGSTLDYGLFVLDDTPSSPTDFTLIGNGMIIRGFRDGSISADGNGDGIIICGHSIENAFDFNGASRFDPAVDDCDEMGPIDGISISNVWLALLGGDGIQIESNGAANLLFDTLKIFAVGSGTDGSGIEIEAGGLSIVNGTVTNSSIHAVNDAIEVSGEKCLFDINFNFNITGLEAGIDVNCEGGSQIHIEDNENIAGKSADGISFDSSGDADGVTITIKRNGDIIGGAGAEA
ncbi:MAG: hypothetical protein IIC89_06505, partial [Chloroflexi bacterium]|nr:hypothetical protein [Chloroflexota bacterium]